MHFTCMYDYNIPWIIQSPSSYRLAHSYVHVHLYYCHVTHSFIEKKIVNWAGPPYSRALVDDKFLLILLKRHFMANFFFKSHDESAVCFRLVKNVTDQQRGACWGWVVDRSSISRLKFADNDKTSYFILKKNHLSRKFSLISSSHEIYRIHLLNTRKWYSTQKKKIKNYPQNVRAMTSINVSRSPFSFCFRLRFVWYGSFCFSVGREKSVCPCSVQKENTNVFLSPLMFLFLQIFLLQMDRLILPLVFLNFIHMLSCFVLFRLFLFSLCFHLPLDFHRYKLKELSSESRWIERRKKRCLIQSGLCFKKKNQASHASTQQTFWNYCW